MLTNATTDIVAFVGKLYQVGLSTSEQQQAATQDSKYIIEHKKLWHAGLTHYLFND